jgi:hypothetical protein
LVGFKAKLEAFTCPEVNVFEGKVNHLLVASEGLVKEKRFFNNVSTVQALHDDPHMALL